MLLLFARENLSVCLWVIFSILELKDNRTRFKTFEVVPLVFLDLRQGLYTIGWSGFNLLSDIAILIVFVVTYCTSEHDNDAIAMRMPVDR